MAHPLRSGGKRIRPLLLLLSAEMVGGDATQCLDAAIAVELLHTFTLVHDDIMDHDDIRRGQPTIHKKWDEPTAILAGDGLVTLAYQSLLQTVHPQLIPVMQRFTDGLLVLCEGQALDKAFEKRDSIHLNEYLDMIYKKTAKLLEVSCEIGGILGNGGTDDVNNLKNFAREMGIAFQIQDDLLDILSEETVFGKPQCSDLIEKKQTYLTLHFQQHATPDQKDRFQRLCEKKQLSNRDIQDFQQLFEETGTLSSTRDMISQGIDKAMQYLAQFKTGESKNILESLAIKIRNRVM